MFQEWLRSPGTNLQRLDQITTHVYNFGLSDVKSLKASPGSLSSRPLSVRVCSAEDLSNLTNNKALPTWFVQS